jgi:outer membrane protein OmpA-like peptidoglycan-associated protein
MKTITRAFAIVSTLAGLTYVASADENKGTTDETPTDKTTTDKTTTDKTTTGEQGERTMQRVYFNFDSASLKSDILDVANNLECTPNDTIILDAYADPVGSQNYNTALAMRRAQAVRDELVDLGISEDRIMLGIFGEKGEHKATHALDRRVEIRTSDEPVATLRDKRDEVAARVIAPGEEVEQVGRR